MLIETHNYIISDTKIPLTFLKSLNVQVFPCGRRRSPEYTAGVRFPFDPEARLNTEANNLKHSSLNGFNNTYLSSWDENTGQLVVSLAGYIFTVDLDDDYHTPADLGNELIELLKSPTEKLYLNILLEEVPLFQGSPKAYNTYVLGSFDNITDPSLDLPTGVNSGDQNNYYFSGLAFSASPLTKDIYNNYVKKEDYPDSITRSDIQFSIENSRKRIVSLCLLEKVSNSWKIHEPARLPKIEHGSTEDSIIMNDVITHSIETPEITVTEKLVANNESSNVDNPTAEIDWLKAKNVAIDEATIQNLTADEASIPNLNSTGQISARKLEQNGYTVPFIGLEPVDNSEFWQLQIILDPSLAPSKKQSE